MFIVYHSMCDTALVMYCYFDASFCALHGCIILCVYSSIKQNKKRSVGGRYKGVGVGVGGGREEGGRRFVSHSVSFFLFVLLFYVIL